MIRASLLLALAAPLPASAQDFATLEDLARDIEASVAASRAERASIGAEARAVIEGLAGQPVIVVPEVAAAPAATAALPAPQAPRVVLVPEAVPAAPEPVLEFDPGTVSPDDFAILTDPGAAAPATPAAPDAPAADAGPLTPEGILAATYAGGDLPDGPAAITAVVQVLLDRSGISPGVSDGVAGGMSTSALMAFEQREGLPVDGIMDEAVWSALQRWAEAPVLREFTIQIEDVAGVMGELPTDYAELAQLPRIDHERATERLAERFHMDEDFLIRLNPGASFAEGETIWVVDPGPRIEGPEVATIAVLKSQGRLAGYDDAGRMVVNYPITVGSGDNPSPTGTHTVVAVAYDPTYHYDPENFVQGENLEPLTLPPGPNGPVGTIWIDLSAPSYGLHGTPNPSGLFQAASHGCVRLTNWDAEELAELVRVGTVVEFVE